MKTLLYLFAAFLIFLALGTALFATSSSKWLVVLANGSIGLNFFFRARSWTPEKSRQIFGAAPRKKEAD